MRMRRFPIPLITSSSHRTVFVSGIKKMGDQLHMCRSRNQGLKLTITQQPASSDWTLFLTVLSRESHLCLCIIVCSKRELSRASKIALFVGVCVDTRKSYAFCLQSPSPLLSTHLSLSQILTLLSPSHPIMTFTTSSQGISGPCSYFEQDWFKSVRLSVRPSLLSLCLVYLPISLP